MQRYAIAALLFIIGSWMSFDGCRAFVVGDYVTPTTGTFAGQLGPWAHVLESARIDPRSSTVKTAHILIGMLCIGSSAGLVLGLAQARTLSLAASVLVLWYLPWGTIVGVLGIVFYCVPAAKKSWASQLPKRRH